jgi:two-component system, cell cycle response regulator DivK
MTAAECAASESPDSTSGGGGKRRILVVEDDVDSREVCRLILEYGGLEVLEAVNGREGLRRARADYPDLILLDISIPEIDGWEVARILKGDEATSAIPVVMLTAHALAANQVRAAQLGCAGFLVKPIGPSRILESVNLHLQARAHVSFR